MSSAQIQKERFAALCAAESYAERGLCAERAIGIYNEKRIHRILKHTLSENEDDFEVKIGKCVADIFDGERITEIQTKNFSPMRAKLKYYLDNTQYDILVVHPVTVKRQIIRAERETGEVLRVRTSPKRESVYDALARLYPVSEFLSSPRVTVRLMLIEAEEYRYSEAMRYRKEGRYDSELFPTKLSDTVELSSLEDYMTLLPEGFPTGEFSASDVKPFFKLTSRQLYSMLNTLSNVGVLEREKQGRYVRYRTV